MTDTDPATETRPRTELIGWWQLSTSIDGRSWELLLTFSTGPLAQATDGRSPRPACPGGIDGQTRPRHPLPLNACRLILGNAYRCPILSGIRSARKTIADRGWELVEGEQDARRKMATGSIRGPKAADR